MSYTVNVPLANETLAQTNFPIRTNFNLINTQFSVNHVALTAGLNNGKHTKIEFDTNHAAGAPVGTQSEMYTTGAVPELYFRNSLNETLLSGIKAWCTFTCANPAVLGATGFNIASATRTAKGQYAIAFTAPMATTTYGVFATYITNAASDGWGDTIQVFNRGVNGFTILARSLLTQTLEDIAGTVSVLVIGN
jgi:hypothetical protein